MIEKELINLLLKKDFYEENKGRVTKEMFTNGTGNLYETISRAHDDSEKDLSLEEVSTLHTEVYNPALTRTAKENFSSLINEIKDRIRQSLVLIDSELDDKYPEAHGHVKSYIMKLERLVQEINDGENNWEIRTMEDAFDG